MAEDNPNAQVLVRAVKFSNGAQWHISQPTPVADFAWTDLAAEGETDMGKALQLVAEQLKMPPMSERALPPVLVLVSDGQPTDDFDAGLKALMNEPWGKKAVRIAISIGRDADDEVLQKFIGNTELKPLAANSPEALVTPHQVGLDRRAEVGLVARGRRRHARRGGDATRRRADPDGRARPTARRPPRRARRAAGQPADTTPTTRRPSTTSGKERAAMADTGGRAGVARHRRDACPARRTCAPGYRTRTPSCKCARSGRGLPLVVSVSDGHGSDKCFRSDRGSRFAVQQGRATRRASFSTSGAAASTRRRSRAG